MDAQVLLDWFQHNPVGEVIYTALMSMLPVVELRGGIPFGVALGLGLWTSYLASVVGNMIAVPFIILFIRRVFAFIRKKFPRFNSLVDRLEKKAQKQSKMVVRYGSIGLCILVAIPLPGTGAWTGAMVAALMDLRMRKAIPAIYLGVALAGIIVLLLTYGVTAMFP